MYSGTLKHWPVNPGRMIDCGDAMKVHIRWMIRRDMPEVLAIEQACFEFPWTKREFVYCLRHRNVIGMVAEHDERVVGFMVYELHYSRLHLLDFGVAPGARRRTVGGQMVEKLRSKLSANRRKVINVEVRETNLVAQVFFAKHGFVATEIIRDFYDDSDEDAYRMVCKTPLDDLIGAPKSKADKRHNK